MPLDERLDVGYREATVSPARLPKCSPPIEDKSPVVILLKLATMDSR